MSFRQELPATLSRKSFDYASRCIEAWVERAGQLAELSKRGDLSNSAECAKSPLSLINQESPRCCGQISLAANSLNAVHAANSLGPAFFLDAEHSNWHQLILTVYLELTRRFAPADGESVLDVNDILGRRPVLPILVFFDHDVMCAPENWPSTRLTLAHALTPDPYVDLDLDAMQIKIRHERSLVLQNGHFAEERPLTTPRHPNPLGKPTDPDDGYVIVSQLWIGEFPSYAKARKYLIDNSSRIRTKPHGQRLRVHAADWVLARAEDKEKESKLLDSAPELVSEFLEGAEKRKRALNKLPK